MAAEAKPPLTVEMALARIIDGVAPTDLTRRVDLLSAVGAVLAAPLTARHTQPPFDASAMDGYAVRHSDLGHLPTTLQVVGEAAAGHAFRGVVRPGEAVRIFTGAPLPAGTDAVIIQENTERNGSGIVIRQGRAEPEHVRPLGGDFVAGATIIAAGRRLTARDVTLAAAAGHSHVTVRKPPLVAILATGDELVEPGTDPGADQIVCSNPYGVAALVAAAGGEARLLGIARDNRASLDEKIAAAADADILVTLGGASVGDHDLVAPTLAAHGLDLAFWKIAMRPGKPMMFGTLGRRRVLGLPGNPVSSLITARLFLVPLIHALLGQPPQAHAARSATLATALDANGPRAHYMRGITERQSTGTLSVRAAANQDSSLLVPLAAADCLIVRPIGAPACPAGAEVPILLLDF